MDEKFVRHGGVAAVNISLFALVFVVIAGLIQFGLYSLIARISSLSAFVSFQPAVEAVAVGGACVLSGSANPLFDSIFFSLEIDSPSANASVRSVRI